MSEGVLDAFLDTVDGVAGRAALTVTAGDRLTIDEAVVETLRAVPGVMLERDGQFPGDGLEQDFQTFFGDVIGIEMIDEVGS